VNPSSIFISSSPTKGTIVDNDEEFLLRWGWIGDTRYGSVHHYDYMSDCENFRSYPTAKFVTEFGEKSCKLHSELGTAFANTCMVCSSWQ
jgi:beta-mannosidase